MALRLGWPLLLRHGPARVLTRYGAVCHAPATGTPCALLPTHRAILAPALSVRALRTAPSNKPPTTPATGTSSSTTTTSTPAPPERFRRDEEITAPFVEVVDVNGVLRAGGPWRPRDILRSLDRREYFLSEVQPEANVPVCRVYSKREQYEKQRQLKERKRSLAATRVSKQLIVSDNVQPHDMQHKLKKARQMLVKGYRVILSVETRPGSNTASLSAKERAKKRTALLTEMIEALRDVTTVAQKIVQDVHTTQVMLQGMLDKTPPASHQHSSKDAEQVDEST
ncbi:hypothetical protein SYNPS1DRAFT_31512 [Syncephalis pseudoplumigaleata]|uniref:Translation initiation factor 3 N-terminal domain-containing protein n=1 Tax=Syncephalis pseudoplumigaleata TaxID=1712513 RepID=A0A4P9YUF5_9FUNG|nr:hypothetical protein SYNPS1DRAFT_31512 [Syncephalis pseudoplumigaleata]|eukprot:RKP22831.1 hypothetical protein SYNPS1DRAFT_31512 [Syncephalis pseudoplumigaleata]